MVARAQVVQEAVADTTEAAVEHGKVGQVAPASHQVQALPIRQGSEQAAVKSFSHGPFQELHVQVQPGFR